MDKFKKFLDNQLKLAEAFKDNREIVISFSNQAFGGVMLMYGLYKDTSECSKASARCRCGMSILTNFSRYLTGNNSPSFFCFGI